MNYFVLLTLALAFNLQSSLYGQEFFRNITLLDHWKQDSLVVNSSQVRYNDCWGFVHQGQEYAVAGSTEGTHIFLMTSDGKLESKAFIKGDFSSSQVVHRDYAVFKNCLYAVCDEGPSALQIINISTLPDSAFLANTISDQFGRVHNIFIDTTSELLYTFTVTSIQNGMPQQVYAMRVFSLTDPFNPSLLYTGPDDINEVHDGYVRNNKAFLNCGFDGLRIYDFSNPAFPVFEQNLPIYPQQGYNHQGWLSPDGEKYVFADETNGKQIKFCEKNENNEWEITRLFGTNFNAGSIPHNMIIDDQFIYVAYYNEGLRIYRYSDKEIREVAYYNTYQEENNFKMNGAWGVYNLFPSKRILVSDRQKGLFLFDFNHEAFSIEVDGTYVIYPNPVKTGQKLNIRLNTFFKGAISVEVKDSRGALIHATNQSNFHFLELRAPESAGMYFVDLTFENKQGEIKKIVEKLIVF